MSKASTNVELESISVVGGEVISDGEKTTKIPPEGKLNKVSNPKDEEIITITLGGKWPPEPEKATKTPEKEGKEVGD